MPQPGRLDASCEFQVRRWTAGKLSSESTKAAHSITSYDTEPQESVQEMVVNGRVLVESMEVME